jgi:hypothetical protein
MRRYLLLALLGLVGALTPFAMATGFHPEHEKHVICHVTGSGSHEIEVDAHAIPAHLAHGDTLGLCPNHPPVHPPVTVTVDHPTPPAVTVTIERPAPPAVTLPTETVTLPAVTVIKEVVKIKRIVKTKIKTVTKVKIKRVKVQCPKPKAKPKPKRCEGACSPERLKEGASG